MITVVDCKGWETEGELQKEDLAVSPFFILLVSLVCLFNHVHVLIKNFIKSMRHLILNSLLSDCTMSRKRKWFLFCTDISKIPILNCLYLYIFYRVSINFERQLVRHIFRHSANIYKSQPGNTITRQRIYETWFIIRSMLLFSFYNYPY